MSARRITAAEVNSDFVLTKCDYFLDVHLWPLLATMDPRRWLKNFTPDETPHAVHLLNSFMYFSRPLVDEMFQAAFQRLSMVVIPTGGSVAAAQAAWRAFVGNALVTYVSGERPNASDSGYAFARKARQLLQVSESQIVHPEDALHLLLTGTLRPTVFVDDFVGSGNQFATTWRRSVPVPGGTASFERIAELKPDAMFFYCPLVSTTVGVEALRKHCPQVVLSAAHIISSRYSVLSDDSIIWPPHLQPTAVDFIRRVSARAGIPDNGGVNDWRGFRRLGLALAFEHCVPDATIPLFYWEQNNWQPLVRRR